MSTVALSVLLALASQSADPAAPASAPPPAAEAAPPPSEAAAPAPAEPAKAEPTPAPAAAGPATEADGEGKKKAKKPFDIRNHLSGPFVGGVGLAVMVVGGLLGGVAVMLQFLPLPFPGGNTEKGGFVTSAVVGSVFCALVGLSLVVVGTALLGVSLIGAF